MNIIILNTFGIVPWILICSHIVEIQP